MTWPVTIATYVAAYACLSVCVGLVLGRLFRTMQPMPALGTPEIIEARVWTNADYRTAGSDRMVGAL